MAQSRYENIWRMLTHHNFEIDNQVSSDVICSICNKIMINASFGPCACKYCLECITKYLDGNEKMCPGNTDDCKIELLNIDENIHIDPAINLKISKLILKCPERMCEFRDEMRKLENHMRLCNAQSVNCPYFNIGCRDGKLAQDKLLDHLQYDNVKHIDLLMESIGNLTNEIESMKNDTNEYRNENRYLRREIEQLKSNDEGNRVNICNDSQMC